MIEPPVQQYEMGIRCAVCEGSGSVIASDGRVMCVDCVKRKKLQIARRLSQPAGSSA